MFTLLAPRSGRGILCIDGLTSYVGWNFWTGSKIETTQRATVYSLC